MLAPLTDYKHGITLIQDSGIQLLDFALTPLLDAEFPGKFVRKTASGPLLRLQWEAESGKYQLPAVGDRPPKWCGRSSAIRCSSRCACWISSGCRCPSCATPRRACFVGPGQLGAPAGGAAG